MSTSDDLALTASLKRILNEDPKLTEKLVEFQRKDDPPSYNLLYFTSESFYREMSAVLTDIWSSLSASEVMMLMNLSQEDQMLLWNTLRGVNFDSTFFDLAMRLARIESDPSIATLNELLKFVIAFVKENAPPPRADQIAIALQDPVESIEVRTTSHARTAWCLIVVLSVTFVSYIAFFVYLAFHS